MKELLAIDGNTFKAVNSKERIGRREKKIGEYLAEMEEAYSEREHHKRAGLVYQAGPLVRKGLIVFCFDLKIALGMFTNRAELRALLPNHDMTAIRALPDLVPFPGEDHAPLNIGEEFAIALFMLLLNGADQRKEGGDVGKTLFLCFLSKGSIHRGPLIVFPCGRVLEIAQGIRYGIPMQQLEPYFGVFLFLFSGFSKEGPYLIIALLLCLGCVIGICIPGLGFSGKSGL
jgi:hypothetical protein